MATPPRKKKEDAPSRLAGDWESLRHGWRKEFQRPSEGPANTAAGRRAAALQEARLERWQQAKASGRNTRPENNDLFEGKVLFDMDANAAAAALDVAAVPRTPNRRTRHANTHAPKRPRHTAANQEGGKRSGTKRTRTRTRKSGR